MDSKKYDKKDIALVDTIREGRVNDSPVVAAWNRIKTALEEAQNTSTNSTGKRLTIIDDATLAQAQAEAKKEMDARELRSKKSLSHYAIPDWQGQGGTVHFWQNDNGTYECMDIRIDDAKIRDGIRAFARDN